MTHWTLAAQRHPDDRGFLQEILRPPNAGQITRTVTYPGVIKAFHMHRRQTDYWYCLRGNIEVVLIDLEFAKDIETTSPGEFVQETLLLLRTNEIRPTYLYLSEYGSETLAIPPYTAHGYRVLGAEPAEILYYTTERYNPKDPDEIRFAYNEPLFNVSWTTCNR